MVVHRKCATQKTKILNEVKFGQLRETENKQQQITALEEMVV